MSNLMTTLEKRSSGARADLDKLSHRGYVIPQQAELLDLADVMPGNGEVSPRAQKDLSVFVDYWHQIPKYASRLEDMSIERTPEGFLPLKTVSFMLNTYNGQKHSAELRINPARIKDKKTGGDIDYYPSPRDEVVEDILIHMAAKEQQAAFDGAGRNSKVYIRYTLCEIQKRLKECKKQRSITEIAETIEILMKTQIEIRINGGRWVKTNILGSGTYSDKPTRREYQVCSLSDIFSAGVWARKYRQFPITLYLRLKSNIARYLFKEMWDQKNLGGDVRYTFKLSQCEKRQLIKEGAATLTRRTVEKALDDLKNNFVIYWDNDNPMKKVSMKLDGKIIDYEYTFDISQSFTTQFKAANMAAKKKKLLAKPNPIIEDMFTA